MTGPREYWPLPPRVAWPWPPTLVWRWRYELAAVAFGGYLARRAAQTPTYLLYLLPIAVALGIALAIPATRAILRQRWWCVLTQHRLRTGLARGWVHDRRGRLPALLWTRSTLDGECVLLWCPAGITAHHLIGAADVLQGACWARDLQIEPVGGYRHLVAVHVIRTARAGAPAP